MRRLHAFVAAVLFVFCVFPVSAQDAASTEITEPTVEDAPRAQGPYQAETTVFSQEGKDLAGGLARALEQVLIKVSGDGAVASRDGVSNELRNARNYLQSYDYREIKTAAGKSQTARFTLTARFDPQKVDALTNVLGLTVWPQPRANPVVWLAIDDGSGPRLVGAKQFSAVIPLLERAEARGYRLNLPQGLEDENALVSAIWQGDVAAIAHASMRYLPPMQLVGKLYRGQSGWLADWSFVENGEVLATWSASNADAFKAMATGADGAADALFERYAQTATGGTSGLYRVVFSGIRGPSDYLRLSAALQNAAVVRRIVPVHVQGDTLELDLDLLGSVDDLKRILGEDSPVVGGEGSPPHFYFK